MSAANNNIQLTQLDFADIKTSIVDYLKSQDTFKDYNFAGSGLSTLIDILAYNTVYNAYYLNQVGNEMFLDTALQRESVVSHAKLLAYTPKSAIAPSATVSLVVGNPTDQVITLPRYSNFLSQSIDGMNYNFVTVDEHTETLNNNVAYFNDIEIKQGSAINYSFVVNNTANPSNTFEIPDANIDTTTLRVSVQNSGTDTTSYTYYLAQDFLALTNTSKVYFLQEGMNGNYEIYFGDGIIGNKLVDGNIVRVSYVSTEGVASAGANSFILLDSVYGFANTTIYPVFPASNGGSKESISSIKYTAPKAYSAQGRAVSKEDYIAILQNNKLGVSFDAVNVWGGQENIPPVYGQVFVALKPSGGYLLTETQKQRLISDVLRPISLMTVEPTIVDPDYVYLQITANVLYDPKITNLTTKEIQNQINTAIRNYANSVLNTFNSIFSISDFTAIAKNVNPSILSAELSIKVQKKFLPQLSVSKTYSLDFSTPLKKSVLKSGISNIPSLKFRNPNNLSEIIDGVYIEEVATVGGGIESISILNPGFGYAYPPKVAILGDGTGATAEAIINSAGSITKINITNKGSDYTSAIVQITNQANDASGRLGAATATLEGRYGTLRSYYFTSSGNVKTIFNPNAGTIDYQTGIVTLTSFNPYDVNNDLKQLTISAIPDSTIISSTYNRIISVDPFDPTAVQVNLITKK